MVKKRDNDIERKVEEFAGSAEGGNISETDRNAKRSYKAISMPFNQYEFEQLEIGARLSGRSKLNFLRFAMLKLVKELQEEASK
jgi:hypothetical protein